MKFNIDFDGKLIHLEPETQMEKALISALYEQEHVRTDFFKESIWFRWDEPK